MKNLELQKIIREEVKKALKEGALLNAITPGLQGEVKIAVQSLETYLNKTNAILDYNHARNLAELVIDIIDAAKDEERSEPKDY
jgi:hypothetical protein